MTWSFPLYSAILFGGVALGLVLVGVAWMRRPTPGALPLAFLLLAALEWEFCLALEIGAIDFPAKILWGKIKYTGVLGFGILWLSFVLDYVGSTWWRRPRNLALLWFFPVASLVMAWTNEWHGLFWPSISLAPGTSGTILQWEFGPWFWLMVAYNYVAIGTGEVVLIRALLAKPKFLRWQVLLLLFGSSLPLVSNVAYLAGFNPGGALDLTPLAFVVAGLIYVVAIVRLHLLDVVPVARSALVEHMPDGILVLNAEGYIVDMNPAAGRIMGLVGSSAFGKQVGTVWALWADVLKSGAAPGSPIELVQGDASSRRYLDVSVTPIVVRRRGFAGSLVVIRDISERRRMEKALRESESRYATLVEQSNDGVLIVQDGVHKFANRTMAEISGYTVDEIVGKPLNSALVQEDGTLLMEQYRLLMVGQPVPTVYEVRLKRKDGMMIEVEISVGR